MKAPAIRFRMVGRRLVVDGLPMLGTKTLTFVSAPSNASITQLTMTSLTVNIEFYTGNPQVDSFKVTLQGVCEPQICKVKRISGQMACPMHDLLPATKYVVKTVACLPKDLECSSPFTLKTWTIPSREC